MEGDLEGVAPLVHWTEGVVGWQSRMEIAAGEVQGVYIPCGLVAVRIKGGDGHTGCDTDLSMQWNCEDITRSGSRTDGDAALHCGHRTGGIRNRDVVAAG